MEKFNFLEELKKGLETGDYNSEAAKKVLEINKMVESKSYKGIDLDKIEKKPAVSEEVAKEANKLAEEILAKDFKNSETLIYFREIANFEQKIHDAVFALGEYYEEIKKNMDVIGKNYTELELKLIEKISQPIDIDEILTREEFNN